MYERLLEEDQEDDQRMEIREGKGEGGRGPRGLKNEDYIRERKEEEEGEDHETD